MNLPSLPIQLGIGAASATVTAVLAVADVRLVPVYVGACAVAYGAGATAWHYLVDPDDDGELPEPLPADLGSADPCETCKAAPAVRQVIADDGTVSEVCSTCTPGPVRTEAMA